MADTEKKVTRNLTEIVAHVAEVTGLKKKDVEAALKAEHTFITNALKSGEAVKVHEFVNFDVTEAAERQGKHPQTGEPITIEAYNTLRAKPTEHMKRELNPHKRK